MKKQKIEKIIISIVIVTVLVWVGIIIIDFQQTEICKFCILTNWTGVSEGDMIIQCQKYQFTNYNNNIKMKEWCELYD